MKCSNCKNNALFEYKITQDKSVFYCQKHLPKFLEARKRADLLILTETFSVAKEEALNLLAPQPVVEEPALEMNRAIHGSTMKATAPEITETSKPAKKASKKKAE